MGYLQVMIVVVMVVNVVMGVMRVEVLVMVKVVGVMEIMMVMVMMEVTVKGGVGWLIGDRYYKRVRYVLCEDVLYEAVC